MHATTAKICHRCGAAEHPAAPFKDADGYCPVCASRRPKPFYLQPVKLKLPRLATLFWLGLSVWSTIAIVATLNMPTTVNVLGVGDVHNLELAQRQSVQLLLWLGVCLFSSAMLVLRKLFRK